MKTSDSRDVIQGDEECRDGHYCAKLDLRSKTATGIGAVAAVELDPNDSTSLQAQNPPDLGKLGVGHLYPTSSKVSDSRRAAPSHQRSTLRGGSIRIPAPFSQRNSCVPPRQSPPTHHTSGEAQTRDVRRNSGTRESPLVPLITTRT